MDLKELLKKGDSMLKEIEALQAKAATEKDEDRKKIFTDEIAAKSVEFDGLTATVEDAKAQAKRRAVLAEAKALSETAPAGDLAPGNDGNADRKPEGKARDHNAEARAKRGFFLDYVCGKSLPDQARELLAPHSKKMREGEAAGGIRMPNDMATAVFGKSWGTFRAIAEKNDVEGKAIPMLSSDSDRSGLVGVDYRKELLELQAEVPNIFPKCTIVPTTSGVVKWPRLTQSDAGGEYGGVTVAYTDEGGEKPETEADFTQATINTHEIAAYTEISHTLLNRSLVNMDALIARLFRGSILSFLDNEILNGSGTGAISGIINTAGVRTVERAGATIAWEDLVALEFLLRAYHRAGASYVLADGNLQALKLLNDDISRPLFVPSYAGGLPDRLNGYPYYGTHNLTVGADGEAIFGHLAEYIVAMEEDVVIKRSDHYKFRNNVAAFTVYMQVGGEAVLPRAFAILADDAS